MRKVMLIGSGAREHAIAYALTKNGNVELYSCQGFANYGISRLSKEVIDTEKDYAEIIKFGLKNHIDFAFVGPEAQLTDGIVDMLEENGIPCASPSRKAARIESDKMFMRSLMDKYNMDGQIRYLVTTDFAEAVHFCGKLNWKVAIKPIGLTAGKGVRVWGDHLKTEDEVKEYINEILTRGISGYNKVLVEELLTGQEFTIHFFCDGNNAYPSVPVQDHKRAYNNDKGPNTGGMGAYSDVEILPFLNNNDLQDAHAIGKSAVRALNKEGCPFKGVLYGQYILTAQGVKVIEFNSRFGDPEAMNTLMLLDSDFPEICLSMISGTLKQDQIKFRKSASLCVYIVPAEYGVNPLVDEPVAINLEEITRSGLSVFFGSCNFSKEEKGTIVVRTTKSRTLAIASTGEKLAAAYSSVSDCLQYVSGKVHYRTDIGSPDSIKQKIDMINKIRAAG